MPLKNPEASRLTGNVNLVFVETLVDVIKKADGSQFGGSRLRIRTIRQTEGHHEMFEAFRERYAEGSKLVVPGAAVGKVVSPSA